MCKLPTLFILISSIILILGNTGESTISSTPTQFRVYLHEFFSGPNATIFEVARANITVPPINFASVRIGNDLMTSGPNMSSEALGRAEALVAFTGRTEGAVLLHLEFMFEGGTYNGSSLGLLGRKRVVNVTEDVPITGGTGVFRLARGYAVSFTHSYDPVADYIIYVYDFYVYLWQQSVALVSAQ